MDNDLPAGQPRSAHSNSVAEAVHATLHFLRVLRRRMVYVVVAVAVSGLLGALYFATSTRWYEAQASLLVTPTGASLWNPSAPFDGSRQARIPTYVQMFYKDVVLDGAVKYLQSQPVVRVDFRDVPVEKWSAVIRGNLTAERERRTNLIDVTYRSRDPRAAEATVAAINRSYLDFIQKDHRDVSGDIVRMLDEERADIERRLNAKQNELLDVKRRSGDLGLGGASQAVHPVVQRVLTLNEDLMAVEKQQIDLKATLSTIRGAIDRKRDLRQYLVAIEPDVGRELMVSLLGLNPQYTEILGKVEQKLIDDRARLDKLLRHYGAAHPDVIERQQVIRDAEQYLVDYRRNVQQRLNRMSNDQLGPMLTAMISQKLAKLKAQQGELARQYEVYEQQAVELNDRLASAAIAANEVERLRHLHDTLLNRIAGIDINQHQADVRVTIASEPTAGARPVSPNLLWTSVLCLVGGVLVGTGVVYVLDLLDDRFQSPEEIQLQLDIPLLALIRSMPDQTGHGAESLCAFTAPACSESEEFRTLRTAIAFSGNVSECLAVTSPEPGDGKTTVLANLGVIYARAGNRTLLIDADMRRPGLSRLFGLRGAAGLAQLLACGNDVAKKAETMIGSTVLGNLHVLPCGARPSDPAELLTHPQFAEVLAWAGAAYDQVLIDCPPVLAASDAAIIARQSDGVLLVLQPEKNHRRLVIRAAQSLRTMQATLVGAVANQVGRDQSTGYFGRNYGYGAYGYGEDDESSSVRKCENASDPIVAVRRRAA